MRRLWLVWKRLFSPPELKDDEQALFAEPLFTLAPTLLVAALAIGLVSVLIQDWRTASILFASGLPLAGVILLARRGRRQAAAWLLALAFVSVATLALWLGHGLHDIGLMIFPTILITSYMLLSRRGARRVVGLCVAAVSLLGLADIAGWTQRGPFAAVPADVVIVDIILLISALIAEQAAGAVRRYLRRAQAELAERRRVEATLRDNEERYRLISTVSSDYVFSSRRLPDGRWDLDWVAGAFEAITGYNREAYQADGGWRAHLHPDDVAIDDRDMATLRKGQAVVTEIRTYNRAQQLRWVRVYGHPVLDSRSGELIGIYGAVQDITEQRLAQDEIRRLNASLEQRVAERTRELEAAVKELEDFSYTISHDLRSPLRAVDGFARIMAGDHGAALPAEARSYLERISQNARHMGRLIDGLLEFIRLGRAPLRLGVVDQSALVEEVRRELAAETAGREVTWIIHPLLPGPGDAGLLQLVWRNLLSNALKFTRGRSPARIEVGCRPPAEAGQTPDRRLPVYYVADNGTGFDMRYASQLFGVFQQLQAGDQAEGIGVGLAMVQRVIHRHGGRIWAEAEEGRGATFYFTLPGDAVHDQYRGHPAGRGQSERPGPGAARAEAPQPGQPD